MRATRGDGPTGSSVRGQSTLMGVVLLIGMVATASVGIFLVAGEAVSDIERQSEQERIAQSFTQMSQSLEDSSADEETSNNINLKAGESGAVTRDETGYIAVESEGLENDLNLTFGTVEYVGEDGTKIAYEAGGVFRETGYQTRVVSAPNIQYDHDSETLTLPVITVTGDERLGTGDISMTHNQTKTFAEANVVENESVDITVRSEYWRGWVTFFERQAGDTVVRNVEQLGGDAAKVTVRVGYLEFDEAFEQGLSYSDSWDEQGSGNMADSLDPQKGDFNEMDSIITEMVDDFENDNYTEPVSDEGTITGGTLTNGSYFADDVTLSNDLTVDLTDGNATLVVDGNFTPDSENLRVTNWENSGGENHTLKVYTTGNIDVSGGEVGPEEINGNKSAVQLQVYGTSTTSTGIDGGSFTGLIFTPSDDFDGPNEVIQQGGCDDYQVCFHSNPEFNGSIVAESAHFHADAMDVNYDDSLETENIDVHPEEYSLPPRLTYLNVAHYEVEVRNK